ncbi:hypothetical protein EIN_482340 [Entamoeba invadens IP1]|uniref:TLDc domain-containing protein n=1 Tax=Entamoeba invadens IP1 TaxID=370355 RepID=A0A0A1U724_ENTIV|nr:hypothetical protein EIN_482340 [Entamoeba invadens IP1]ELP90190.1 hypothetical protein EIN_482340 [Entamoeba invadens IP1]|eukprot:XP_004256961.1 hypothetical protein EIN_482340 [Entamoeba invadens IP1]
MQIIKSSTTHTNLLNEPITILSKNSDTTNQTQNPLKNCLKTNVNANNEISSSSISENFKDKSESLLSSFGDAFSVNDPTKNLDQQITDKQFVSKRQLRSSQVNIEKNENDIINEEEKNQIYTWSGKKVNTVVFDSEKDTIKRGTKKLFMKIKNCNGSVLIIEDNEGNKFGFYISKKVDKMDKTIYDDTSFVFVLQKQFVKNFQKFGIKSDCTKNVFCVDGKNKIGLFSIGNGDLKVYKSHKGTTKCTCKQNSFDSGDNLENLFGENETTTFVLKRITFKYEILREAVPKIHINFCFKIFRVLPNALYLNKTKPILCPPDNIKRPTLQ